MSLNNKFALFALLLGLLLVFQWTASMIRERHVLMEEAEERAGVLTKTLAELAREPLIYGGLGQLNKQLSSFMEERDVEYIFICDSNSMVVAASDSSLPGWTLSSPRDGLEVLKWADNRLLVRFPINIPGKSNAYVEMSMTKTRLDQKIKSNLVSLGHFLALELLLSIVFMALMYRQLFIPVKSLVKNLYQAHPDRPALKLVMPKYTAPEVMKIAEAIDDLQLRAIEYRNELLKEEKLATIGRMAAEIAHEIRNPLTAISGAAELIGNLVPKSNIYLKILNEEVQNLNEYLSGVLEFSRNGNTAAEYSDLAQICKNAVSLVAATATKNNIRIETFLPNCFVYIIKNDIQRVVLNLLLNAIEASSDGASIKLSLSANSETACIRVSDEGTGIDADKLNRIFEPFFTTKPDGTGLGLSLSRKAVEKQGGSLSLQKGQHKGMVAELCIPVRGV